MNESQKQFWVCTKRDGKTKEVVVNWAHNMNNDLYPEYERFEGPFDTRKLAEQYAGISK